MNLQEELKSLKERIAELEEQIKEEREFPREDEVFWLINIFGKPIGSTWGESTTNRQLIEIGNMFRTKEQAEFAAEKLRVEAELRKFSRPFEYGKFNYHLFFDIDGNSFRIDFTSYCPLQGAIHFESEEKAQEAVSAVGKERIKKYLFGVEDYL